VLSREPEYLFTSADDADDAGDADNADDAEHSLQHLHSYTINNKQIHCVLRWLPTNLKNRDFEDWRKITAEHWARLTESLGYLRTLARVGNFKMSGGLGLLFLY
jgi:hypothetical protein